LLKWLKWGWESFTNDGYWRVKPKVQTAVTSDAA
jgi:hypothetical protein